MSPVSKKLNIVDRYVSGIGYMSRHVERSVYTGDRSRQPAYEIKLKLLRVS